MKSVTVLASSVRLLVPLFLAAVSAHAANSRWTGAALDGLWTNPANWTAGVPGLVSPGTTSADTAGFDLSTSTTITADAGRNIFGLKFDNSINIDGTGAAGFTVNGGPLVFTASAALPTLEVAGMIGMRSETVNTGVTILGTSNNNDLIVTTSNGYDGVLQLNGAISSGGATGTTALVVRAGLGGSVNFAGNISNGTGTNVLGLTLATSNAGTVTLSGANTFTGGMSVNNGALVLDYSTNASVVASAQPLTIGGATFTVRGKATGTTAVTLDATTGNDLTIPTLTGARLVVDNNGGSGTTLTLGNTWSRSSGSTLLIDLSSGGSLISSPVADGSLVGTGYFVKDAGGTGLAMRSGSNIVRLTGAPLLTGAGNAANNFRTVGGALTTTATFNTLEFDASNVSDSRVLDLGAFNLTPGGILTMLATGANNFTITGTTGSINNNSVLYHAGTGTLDIEVAINGGFTKAGPGFTIIGKNTSANFTMTGGVTRFTATTVGANIALSGGAVMEIGADMNGVTAGDFTRPLGTGGTGVQIVGSGGFSASGADRIVNLGGASAQVTWGSSAGTNLLNGVFVLSSDHSDATLEFQNPINLAVIDRGIQVNNGSAAVDARLSGAISSSSGIDKTGAGTLELSASNTYAGNTRVDAGRLLLTGTLSGTNAVIVGNGATLELGSADRVNDAALLRLEGGTVKTGGFNETLAALSLGGNSTIDLGAGASVLHGADSSGDPWTGTLSILNWSGQPLVGGGTDELFFGATSLGLTAAQVGQVQFVNPDGLPAGTYGAQILASGEVVAVPEPGAWVMLAGGLAWLLGGTRARRREQRSAW